MGFWDRLKEDMKKDMEKANNKAAEKASKRGSGPSIKLEYIGGHPKIKPSDVFVRSGNEKYTLVIDGQEVTVTKIEWDEKGKRSAGKAAAGAVIGGVLTGGIGLLAGAAIGGRKKDNSLAVITFQDGPLEGTIYFRCDSKEYSTLSALL